MSAAHNIQQMAFALSHFVGTALTEVYQIFAEQEVSAVNPTKPYKPRVLKNDTVHRLARQLYKLKARDPNFKRKQRLYRKQYVRKNKMLLERRRGFVKKARESRGLASVLRVEAESKENYLKRLAQTFKIQQIGEGYYSKVFQHPVYHNVAVKLVSSDPKYIRYVSMVKAHPNNPWLPQIVGVVKTKLDRSPAYLVFMEKLERAFLKDEVNAVLAIYDSLEFKSDKEKFFLDKNKLHLQVFINRWGIVASPSNNRHIRELGAILHKLKATDVRIDNLMMRGSQPVITDPVTS